MTAAAHHEEILSTLSRMIREVIGEEWADDLEIQENTSFNDDLELESIEFVAVAEKLQAEYGAQVDFVSWLSGKQLDEILQLSVGELAGFIARSLSGSPASDCGP